MIRLILLAASLSLLAGTLAGCHADVDVDPHGATQVVPGR